MTRSIRSSAQPCSRRHSRGVKRPGTRAGNPPRRFSPHSHPRTSRQAGCVPAVSTRESLPVDATRLRPPKSDAGQNGRDGFAPALSRNIFPRHLSSRYPTRYTLFRDWGTWKSLLLSTCHSTPYPSRSSAWRIAANVLPSSWGSSPGGVSPHPHPRTSRQARCVPAVSTRESLPVDATRLRPPKSDAGQNGRGGFAPALSRSARVSPSRNPPMPENISKYRIVFAIILLFSSGIFHSLPYASRVPNFYPAGGNTGSCLITHSSGIPPSKTDIYQKPRLPAGLLAYA